MARASRLARPERAAGALSADPLNGANARPHRPSYSFTMATSGSGAASAFSSIWRGS
jgi:hypothetical protein